MAVTTPSLGEGSFGPLLPGDSNALTTAHYLMKILAEIQDNVNEINSMEISGEMRSSLDDLLENAKWGFEDVLTHTWVRGASMLVDWASQPLLIWAHRCPFVLLFGNLGAVLVRTLHDRISVRCLLLPTAGHDVGLQVCKWSRGTVVVVVFLSHREAFHSHRIREQDFQSVFGCHVRVLGWARAAGDGRLARHRRGELSHDDRKCRCQQTASNRYVRNGEFYIRFLSGPTHWTLIWGWLYVARTHARSSSFLTLRT